MSFLIRFDDEQALDAQMVGQKFCNLAKAFRAGFAVPQAVAISTKAHQYYLTNNTWPDGLAEEVLNAAYALEISQGLSIRSSAIREDLEKQSFAGQYRTFLQVVDKKDLKHNIEACWKSVSSEALQSYLQANKLDVTRVETPLMGVVIQKMIKARAAGIAFGRNPLKPSANEIVIEAVEGLAEDLVSGQRSPHRAIINADWIVKLTPPKFKGRGSVKTEPRLQLTKFWLDIAHLVRKLESQDGKKSLDIEWAVDDDSRIWLLQLRPITTLEDRNKEIPAGLWTRKIANDLWADRLTPFLAHHMVTKAPLFDMSRILNILGIPTSQPTLTTIHGYLYINCKNIKTAIAYVPHKLRLMELNHLLPPSVRTENLPSPSIWRLASIGLRSILLLIIEPGINPFICPWLTKYHLRKINRQIDRVANMPTNLSRQTMIKIQSTMEILSQLQIYNQWPYFFATFTTWAFRWLAVDCMGFSHGDFLSRLSHNAGNVTIDIERDFRNMASEITRDAELTARFLNEAAYQLTADLPQNLKNWLDNFISRYGCRSRHRTLLIKRWYEEPDEVIGILQSLVRNQQLSSTPDLSENNLVVSKIVQNALESKDKSVIDGKKHFFLSRWVLWLVTRFTRIFLDLRENLRFALDRILYLLRQSLLTIGSQIDLGENVLFLNADELEGFVNGDLSFKKVKLKARHRHDMFTKPFDVATYFNNGRGENEFDSNGVVLHGIGTSPGRVQGHAKIIEDPALADIQSGDILIAKNTDPGWTPIMSIVSGMVVEEGGLLNHCSIVARELGVPTVVGVHRATQQIHDNDLITIDGGLGFVKIEE